MYYPISMQNTNKLSISREILVESKFQAKLLLLVYSAFFKEQSAVAAILYNLKHSQIHCVFFY